MLHLLDFSWWTRDFSGAPRSETPKNTDKTEIEAAHPEIGCGTRRELLSQRYMAAANMEFVVEEHGPSEWAQHTAGFGGHNLLQTWAYGEAKRRTDGWRVERGLFMGGGSDFGAAQILVRSLPYLGGGLAWVNRGPLRRRGDGASVHADMLSTLRRTYVDGRGLYLRVAPGYENDGGMLPETGFAPAGTLGWASARLDLARSTDDLRRGLAQKWRNRLNKAERLDLDVHTSVDDETFVTFLREHGKFLSKSGFETSVTTELLAAIQAALPAEDRMMAFIAYEDGEPVSSVLIVRYGDTCEYLAGNMTPRGRELNAGQLLLWRALVAMRERGARLFDVGGMDPELTPDGVYRFKAGLGGEPYRLAPEAESAGGGWLARLVRWRVARARAPV